MNAHDPAIFHKLYGVRKPRVAYFGRDFLDYLLMIRLSGFVLDLCYGAKYLRGAAGLVLCGFALVAFGIRHGINLVVPVLFRRPQEVLHMFLHKLENLRPVYLIALGVGQPYLQEDFKHLRQVRPVKH